MDTKNYTPQSYWDELCVDISIHFLKLNIATNHLVTFHNKIVFECVPYPSLALYGQYESSVNAESVNCYSLDLILPVLLILLIPVFWFNHAQML